ncbi:MAG TPA: hypothetical protein VLE70_17515 [Anaerolineae bacterium]|jgi:hypothetical protein|nr:hypothetical protein [Anaerolineae bacterium]
MKRHLYLSPIFLLALIVMVMVATPVAAVEPVTATFQFADVIEGYVPACDLNLRWDISGTVDRTFFFDQDGNVVRILDHVQEDNTITNLDTGESLREGPDHFIQHIFFNDDGTVRLDINGLSVLVNSGENMVVDAGRVVLFFGPGGPSVLQVAGRHDVRGIDPLTVDDPILLEGFCAAFE